MPASYVYKAEGSRGKKGIFLTPQEDSRSTPFAILPDGRRIEGRYQNTNEGRHQYLFGNDILGQKGVKIEYGGKTIDLEDSNKSYEGNNPYDGWSYRNKGDLGSGGSGGGGGNFSPVQVGDYGFAPGYQGDNFPDPSLIKYNPIDAAPYKYVDPQETTAKIGEFNRGEVRKNFDLSRDIALQELDTELEGLTGFVPAASALKRSEASKDNAFNQAERTAQVNATLPNAGADLEAQRARANAYAEGRAPDSVTDAGLELTARSAAADRSVAGGFGAQSSVARKASDLMSAQQRIGLSQYGDRLLSGNINDTARLFLAPTTYSDASSQIRVTPEVGGARLQSGALSEINGLTTISPSTALSAEINQNQFTTGLEQQTRQFNATNDLNTQQFNASTVNSFALQKFNYDVAYAGAMAGAAQTNANTALAIEMQKLYGQIYADSKGATQDSNNIAAGMQGVGAIASTLFGPGGYFNQGGGGGGGQTPNNGGNTGSPSDTSGGMSQDPSTLEASPLPTGYDSAEDVGGQTTSISVPSGDSVPDGYTGIMSDPNGGTVAVPTESITPAMANFSAETGVTPFSSTGSDNSITTERLLSASAPVISNAGLSSQPSPGTQYIGIDKSGANVYTRVALASSPNIAAGSQQIQGVSQGIEPLGAYTTQEDRESFNRIGQASSDPEVLGRLDAASGLKDPRLFMKEAVSAVGKLTPEEAEKSFQTRDGVTAAFTSYEMYNKWDKMSGAQKALAMSSLGMQTYKFADGTDLSTKPLVKNADGTTALNLGQGINMLNSGTNAYSLVKNWDQLNTLQKITQGAGTANSIAVNAKNFNMLGNGVSGSEVPISSEQLGKLGWTPAPSLGVGAVTSPNGASIPDGYVGVEQRADGSVVAVPKGTESSAKGATGLGSTTGRQIMGGVAVLGGAAQVYAGWGQGGSRGVANGAIGGSAMASGLATMGESNPYVLGAVVAGSILGNTVKNEGAGKVIAAGTAGAVGYSAVNSISSGAQAGQGLGAGAAYIGAAVGGYNILTSDMTDAQKAKASRHLAEDTAAGITTLGISTAVQAIDRQFLGGQTDKFRDKYEKYVNPGSIISDKITEKVIGQFGGGKGEAQVGRDAIRSAFVKNGFASKDYKIALADGTQADIGIDGNGGKHAVTNPDLLSSNQKKVKDLHSYDIDYTNDMDFAAGMGGVALSRLTTGRTGTEVDQMGGQLGNASLGSVGYGKEMTKENFTKVQMNQRSMYAKAGISSKADGYQLANQAFAEGRLNETDHQATLQGLNMVFDDNGYDTASKLMAGRHRGVEAVTSGEGAIPAEGTPRKEGQGIGDRVFRGPKLDLKNYGETALNGDTPKKYTPYDDIVSGKTLKFASESVRGTPGSKRYGSDEIDKAAKV